MSRRALREIGKGLDLGSWLKEFADLPRPWSAGSCSTEALFGQAGPLEVELGSGKGLFLSAAGAARRETNFLGLEVSLKYARHAAARAAKLELGNVRVMHGDGLRVFSELLPDASLAAVHVYFPDPWWKARHHKRRVMNERFVKDVERTLVSGGRLHFWTDVKEYFDVSLEVVAAHTHLAGPFDVDERAPEHDLDYRTHFERRTRLGGLPVYRAEFRRV
ncbi:MAG TPA: tRNA (guanosine(46)-N7)-methyltransferase TrmB [Pirellulales bacterium]|nr:tRNA (guanosine(46)-N7)-methyltransferase TrmB [Pirellulales bacterium]